MSPTTLSSTLTVNRRAMLVTSELGFAGFAFGQPSSADAVETSGQRSRAKSTILFFLCGGASHVDMWDLKPDAPRGACDHDP